LLSSEYEDVFTDSLVQSVHELWPTITAKAMGLKGFVDTD